MQSDNNFYATTKVQSIRGISIVLHSFDPILNPFPKFSNLKSFLDNGGKVLILLEEGGERKSSSNVNYFMEEFGISINNGKCHFQNF